MFRIEMLPAGCGDCILIEYGDATHTHRVLIDGGTPRTAMQLQDRVSSWPQDQREIELFIITHIDSDHIGGALKWLHQNHHAVSFGDIWFNAWDQIAPPDLLGTRQGEALGELIKMQSLPHNEAFQGRAVVIPNEGPLPTYTLPGGMHLTVLSPRWQELNALCQKWEQSSAKEGIEEPSVGPADLLGEYRLQDLAAQNFRADSAPANGSSIAILAEFEGKTCLFAADAYEQVLRSSIECLSAAHGKSQLSIDAFKIPHHGSKKNVSIDLIRAVDCHRYLISTNGETHHHPDQESIARIICANEKTCELYFNYECSTTTIWKNNKWQLERNFSTFYPSENMNLIIDL